MKKNNLPFLLLFAAVCVSAGEKLTLQEALREALSRSEEALMLDEKAAKSDAQKNEAWSSAFPHVNGFASAGRAQVVFDPSSMGFPGSLFDFRQSRFSYGVEANQSIFSFGRLGLVIKAATIMDRADDASRLRARQQLQLQALDAFFGAVTSQARLTSLKASLKRQRELVAFIESNFRMGAGLRSSVLLATSALKSLEPQRLRAERDADAARMALNRMLGRSIEAPLDLDTAGVLMLPALVVARDSASMQNLIDQRPDVLALGHQKKFMEAEARYFKMQYLPALGAQGKWDIAAYKLDQLGDFDRNSEWQLGLGLTWNLFDGFGSLSKARQFEADARSIELVERQARKMVHIEIESAVKEYQAADTALIAAQQFVEAATEAQSLISDDFRSGKGLLVDLLAAEQNLREAEFGALAARYMNIRSRAALQVALGKNLINEEEKP